MPIMKYYKEAQERKQQEKHVRWQQQEIAKSDKTMQQSLKQISCRTLRYCKNGDTKHCHICKWNKSCGMPQGDFYKEKIPGIKVLP